MAAGPCPDCGETFERLGQHWTMSSDCDHPSISDETMDVIVGTLLGDGTIHDPDSAKNVQFQVTNINLRFLEWLDGTLGPLSNGVTLHRSSSRLRRQNENTAPARFRDGDYDIRDQYVLRTVRHPRFQVFREWYADQKRFPGDLELTPNKLKLWYVCDGSLLWGTRGHRRAQAWITAHNEKDRPSLLSELFEETPCDPTINDGRVMFTSDDTERLLSFIGEPIPGFEYKFAAASRDRYLEMREAFYRRNTTTHATDESPTTGSDN
jgi:hypothetical protein